MKEHFCKNCSKKICESDCIDAEIVCHRCKTLNELKYFAQSKLLRLGEKGINIKL